jgi:integrase
MFRDVHRDVKRNPFSDLPKKWWPRQQQEEPDPFTEEERDLILDYYRANRPYKAYAVVYFRFYTGTRPSEVAALKYKNIDFLNAKATVTTSRTLGEENAPKTAGSARTFKLLPNVVETLKPLLPLHVEPDTYVFTNEDGQPIEQNEFGRKFGDVLRVLKIRPRPFYNTRHTHISIALTLGCNPKWVAEQTGTSLAMIERHYGKYIRDDGDALLRAYVGLGNRTESQNSPEIAQTEELIEAKTGTFAETSLHESRNYSKSLIPSKLHRNFVGTQRDSLIGRCSNRVNDQTLGQHQTLEDWKLKMEDHNPPSAIFEPRTNHRSTAAKGHCRRRSPLALLTERRMLCYGTPGA